MCNFVDRHATSVWARFNADALTTWPDRAERAPDTHMPANP